MSTTKTKSTTRTIDARIGTVRVNVVVTCDTDRDGMTALEITNAIRSSISYATAHHPKTLHWKRLSEVTAESIVTEIMHLPFDDLDESIDEFACSNFDLVERVA